MMNDYLSTARLEIHAAVRGLRRDWFFSLATVTVASVAFGAVGMLTAGYWSLSRGADAYPKSQQIAALVPAAFGAGTDEIDGQWLATAASLLPSVTAVCSFGMTMHGVVEASGMYRTVSVGVISARCHDVLHVLPAFGRRLEPADELIGAESVALVSKRIWRSMLGGDGAATGNRITVDGRRMTVVGVMPDGFDFPFGVQLWVPERRRLDGARSTTAIVRLRDGATVATLNSELASAPATTGATRGGRRPIAVPFATFLARSEVGRFFQHGVSLLAVVLAIIVCLAQVTLVNFVVTRNIGRRDSLRVRVALGATRWHIARLVSIESGILGSLFVIGGVAVATVGGAALHGVIPLVPQSVVYTPWSGPGVVSIVAAGAMAAVIGTAAACSVAFVSGRRLMPSGRGSAGTLLGGRLLGLALGVQVALAGAVLGIVVWLAGETQRMAESATGDVQRQLAVSVIDIGSTAHAISLQSISSAITLATQDIPSVARGAIACISLAPGSSLHRVGAPTNGLADHGSIQIVRASIGLFDALGDQPLAGRTFIEGDDIARSVVLDSLAAAALFANYFAAIGQGVEISVVDGPSSQPMIANVVGVVRPRRHHRWERAPIPTAYLAGGTLAGESRAIVRLRDARLAQNPAVLDTVYRRLVAAMPRGAVANPVELMSAFLEPAQARLLRGAATVFGAVAAGTILLAATGIFALVSLQGNLRRRELAIRSALGAHPARLIALVLRDATTLAGVGSAIGVLIAFGGARTVQGMIDGLQPPGILTLILPACAVVGFVLVPAARLAARLVRLNVSSALT